MSGRIVKVTNWKPLAGFALLSSALLLSQASAQEIPNGATTQTIVPASRELIEAKLKEVEELQGIDEDAKGKICQLYQQALQDLEAAAKLALQAGVFEAMATDAPANVQRAKASLLEKPLDLPPSVPEGATLTDLEQSLSQNETELSKAKQELDRISGEPARRSSRRSEIPNQVVALREQLADIEIQLAAPALPDELPQLTAARQMSARAKKQAVEQEISTCEKELAAYAADGELLLLQRDLAARQVAHSEATVSVMRDLVNQLRQKEAERLAAEAHVKTAQTHPLLQAEAAHNQALAETNTDAVPKIKAVLSDLEQITKELDRVKTEFKNTQEKADKAGLTEGIGILLRRQLSSLPDVRDNRRDLQRRRVDMRTAELLLLELDDERYTLSDTEEESQRRLAGLGPLPSDVKPGDLQLAYHDLLETRRDLLDKLIGTYDSYFDALVRYDSAQSLLLKEVTSYEEYLRERVLWIRSTAVLKASDARWAGEALVWLLGPENWIDVLWAAIPYGRQMQVLRDKDTTGKTTSWSDILGTEIAKQPMRLISAVLFLLVFMVLVGNRRRLRRQIKDLGSLAARRNCQRIRPTLHSLFDTFLVALLWPSVVLFFGWRLATTISPSDFVRALGYGMAVTGVYYFFFEFMRQVCRPAGLAIAHFEWPEAAVASLRRTLRVLLLVSVPLVLIVATLHGQPNDRWQNSLARICYVVIVIFAVCLAHYSFRRRGALFQSMSEQVAAGWIYRLGRFWYVMVLVSLIFLGSLALIGYYYTAYELAFRFQETLGLIFGLALLGSIVLRWLRVDRRRLRVQQARERRRVATAQLAARDQTTLPVLMTEVVEQEMDLVVMSEQSRRLLQVFFFAAGFLGLWAIWTDVLPALGILERVQLWQTTGERWITLEHVAFSFLLISLTVLAVRNIPGLLELTVLQRLPIDAGARYAITTCIRYLLTVVGLVLAFRTIGIEWSQYQWLVAAASVGLGFGLQEIFANFVSGLIVLMERPIRVGDVVTVESVTGVVSRIRMRATTVMNWDRQEFIVPNKEFISGRLLNWTLSNTVNRIVVHVGVAYGSDTNLVTELLLQIARENSSVLDDPPPIATFAGFGDSTLDFALRCYLPNTEVRLDATHEIHSDIHLRFAEAGIEIAFPQRDLHIRSTTPLGTTFGERDGGPAEKGDAHG